MTQESRRRLLIDAVHAAAIECAKDADAARYPMPVLDEKPTPEEIHAFGTREPISPDTDEEDELWSAAAISPDGKRCWGIGRTAADAKAFAWASSNRPDGIGALPFRVPTEIPGGWTFELYGPPTKPRSKMLAIGPHEIFARIRLEIPDVAVEEIEEAIMQSLPYMGGSRQ